MCKEEICIQSMHMSGELHAARLRAVLSNASLWESPCLLLDNY